MTPERLAAGFLSAHRLDNAIEVSRVVGGNCCCLITAEIDILQGASKHIC